MSIIGIIFGVISLLFFPIVFGPVGIALAAIAFARGDRKLGRVALTVAAVGTVVGMTLGALMASGNSA